MYIHEYIYNLQDIVNYSPCKLLSSISTCTTTHYIVTHLLDIRKSLFLRKLIYAALMEVILVRLRLNLFAVMAKFDRNVPSPSFAIFETFMVLRHILPGYSVRRLNL